jgi:hypothetical protein
MTDPCVPPRRPPLRRVVSRYHQNAAGGLTITLTGGALEAVDLWSALRDLDAAGGGPAGDPAARSRRRRPVCRPADPADRP